MNATKDECLICGILAPEIADKASKEECMMRGFAIGVSSKLLAYGNPHSILCADHYSKANAATAGLVRAFVESSPLAALAAFAELMKGEEHPHGR